jgi:hypothetical protein
VGENRRKKERERERERQRERERERGKGGEEGGRKKCMKRNEDRDFEPYGKTL